MLIRNRIRHSQRWPRSRTTTARPGRTSITRRTETETTMMPRADMPGHDSAPGQAEERIDGIVIRRIHKEGFACVKAQAGTEYFLHLSDGVGDDTWTRHDVGPRATFVPTTMAAEPRGS